MKNTKMLKRSLALLLAVGAAWSLAACNTPQEGEGTNPAPDKSSSEQDQPQALPQQETGGQTAAALQPFINLLAMPDATIHAQVRSPDQEVLNEINAAHMQNEDVVGWLKVPGTDINAEVLQGEDNRFYERSDITKNYNWYGCYYADYECGVGARQELSKNTIIYGHNMKDDPNDVRFAQLIRYLDEDFAKNNPYIQLTTPEDDMVFQIFAVSYIDTSLPYVYPERNGRQFLDLVSELRERSIYDYDVEVGINDKLLTLSTCTYKYGKKNDQQRYLVVGRLLRPGEAVAETVSLTVNPDPKEPVFKELNEAA